MDILNAWKRARGGQLDTDAQKTHTQQSTNRRSLYATIEGGGVLYFFREGARMKIHIQSSAEIAGQLGHQDWGSRGGFFTGPNFEFEWLVIVKGVYPQ